jgi:prophage tail gpP-like protein
MTTRRKETIVFTGVSPANVEIDTLRFRLDKLQRKALAEADDREKAIRFDLDRAGIERREAEAAELVELRAKVARRDKSIERYRRVITILVQLCKEAGVEEEAIARIERAPK